MALVGLIVDVASIPALTRDFLALKRHHFPGRFTSSHMLGHILTEIKGTEILQMTRSDSRNKRRQAQRFRTDLFEVIRRYDCKILGRVWIKESGKTMDPIASYCYAIQDITQHFNQYLLANASTGVVISDSREHKANINVAHSIFTKKWSVGGDAYPTVSEVPVFAASDNHAGLQLADLVATTLVFPMAAAGCCIKRPTNVHSSSRYTAIRTEFGDEVSRLQFRYRDEGGRWRGGLVVSDPVSKRPGSRLFRDTDPRDTTSRIGMLLDQRPRTDKSPS